MKFDPQKIRPHLLACAMFVLILPRIGLAASIPVDEAAVLLERLNQLERELSELRMKLSAVEAAQQDQSERVAAFEEEDQEAPKSGAKGIAQGKNSNSISWKGVPELKSDDGWRFKPLGRMQFDAANLSSLPTTITTPGEGFSNEARRIRLGAQGSMLGGFGYKFEVDFLDGVGIFDAYFDYKTGPVKIVIGQHNSHQGLEELSSSNDTSFIERSAWTDAFGFKRKVGISGIYKVGDFLLQGGVFTDNVADLNDDNDSIGFDARLVAAPKLGNAQLHFGGSYHWRDLADSINTIRYRQRPLDHSIDTRFIDTGDMSNTTEELTYGLETALIAGRFHAAAETHWATVTREGFTDPTFFGGSLEMGFFLTDDTRVYKDGKFSRNKVSNPVSDGGLGAWQVNLRFDHLDLVDADVVGGVQDAFMASLIWKPVDHVRFLLNYSYIKYSDAAGIVFGAPREYGIDVFGARAQLDF